MRAQRRLPARCRADHLSGADRLGHGWAGPRLPPRCRPRRRSWSAASPSA